jgi:hypothetical protein
MRQRVKNILFFIVWVLKATLVVNDVERDASQVRSGNSLLFNAQLLPVKDIKTRDKN